MISRWSKWKSEWREFAAQSPGRRFRARYEHRRGQMPPQQWWRRALNIAIGLVLFAIGAFFAVAPGPAVVFFAIGGIVIANESRVAASLLDRIDVLLAPLFAWIVARWRKLSKPARRVAAVCVVSGSVLAIVAGFLLMR